MRTKPFDRQSDESAPAYEAFVAYRDLGATRRIKDAAGVVSKNPSILEKWSRLYKWVERSRMWDTEVDRRKRLGELKAVEKMRQRQIEMSLLMQGVANEELLKLAKRALAKKEDLVIDPDMILKLAKEGSIMERLNRGEPGEIVQKTLDSEIDYTLLSVEEIMLLRKMKRKLREDDE